MAICLFSGGLFSQLAEWLGRPPLEAAPGYPLQLLSRQGGIAASATIPWRNLACTSIVLTSLTVTHYAWSRTYLLYVIKEFKLFMSELNLTIDDFLPLLQQTVTIRFHHPTAELPAEVIAVTPLNNHGEAERHPFSVLLRTQQRGQYYQQAIYTLLHPTHGEVELFLVPLGGDDQGMKYELVFN